MAFRDKTIKSVRQGMVELGKDTDIEACKKLGGKRGSDGICRVIETGVGEDGDIHLKRVRGDETPSPQQ